MVTEVNCAEDKNNEFPWVLNRISSPILSFDPLITLSSAQISKCPSVLGCNFASKGASNNFEDDSWRSFPSSSLDNLFPQLTPVLKLGVISALYWSVTLSCATFNLKTIAV